MSNIKEKEKNNSFDSNKYELHELKVKEKLYTLFYELTSELKETKIEIDEDEYEENIRTSSVFQIIDYIYQTLQIISIGQTILLEQIRLILRPTLFLGIIQQQELSQIFRILLASVWMLQRYLQNTFASDVALIIVLR